MIKKGSVQTDVNYLRSIVLAAYIQPLPGIDTLYNKI